MVSTPHPLVDFRLRHCCGPQTPSCYQRCIQATNMRLPNPRMMSARSTKACSFSWFVGLLVIRYIIWFCGTMAMYMMAPGIEFSYKDLVSDFLVCHSNRLILAWRDAFVVRIRTRSFRGHSFSVVEPFSDFPSIRQPVETFTVIYIHKKLGHFYGDTERFLFWFATRAHSVQTYTTQYVYIRWGRRFQTTRKAPRVVSFRLEFYFFCNKMV